jgi:anti-sigma B factor antagonist
VSEFMIKRRNGGRDVVLCVLGSVDLATAPELEQAIADALDGPGRRLVLDLRRVDFMDASGVAILLRHDQRARAASRSLLVVRGPPQVQRLFELTDLSARITVVDEFPRFAA